jgi:predicted XRE-type DNA-binding protein
MTKNFKTSTSQRQLFFDLDEANAPPSLSGQSIAIHIHSKEMRERKPNRLKEPTRATKVNQRQHTLSDIQHNAPGLNQRICSANTNKFFHFQESQLKTQIAHQVLHWITEDQLSFETTQGILDLSEEKFEALLKGNLTRLSFYEILESLTQFGFNALICIRPTDKKEKGRILMEF